MNKNTGIKTLIGVVAFTCMLKFPASSQNVGINTSGSNANIHAILDLNTGNAGNTGLIIPNVSLSNTATQFNPPMASAPSGGETGMMVYNTNAASLGGVGYYYWNGAQWVSVGGAATANNGLSVLGSVVQLGDPTTAVFPTANKFSVGREVTENGFPMIFDVGDGSAGNNSGNWSIQNNVGVNKNPAFFVGYNGNGNPAVEIGNAAAPANILFNVQAAAAPAAMINGATINIYGQNGTAGGGKGGQILLAAGLSTGNNPGANVVLQPSKLSGSSTVNGSVSMNMYGTVPNASAFVDMSNSNGAGTYGNKGMLIPEITSASNSTAAINAIIPGAAPGLLIFNVATGCFLYYAGAPFNAWMELYCPCTGPPALTVAGISGCIAVAAGATNITYAVIAPQPGVSYNWALSTTNGTIISATFGNSITVNWNAAATGVTNVVVTANNSCGASNVNYPVTVVGTSLTAFPVGNIPIPGGAGPYTVAPIAGATYAWSFVSGAGTFTAPTSNSTSVNWTGANNSTNQATIQCVVTLPGGCGAVTASYTQIFHGTAYTHAGAGGPFTFTVPNGITILSVVLNGAKGGESYNNVLSNGAGGWGATVNATLTITTQTTWTIYLGGIGGNPPNSFSNGVAGTGGSGGDEAGGLGIGSAITNWALPPGYGSGGGGGGASSMRTSVAVGGPRYLVAGGGGGCGGDVSNGGGGGGIGQPAQAGSNCPIARGNGGNPGTAGAGGAGVTGGSGGCVASGTSLAGGIGIGSAGVVVTGTFNCNSAGGGGGGGGWYAGSGGAGGGGGGGYSNSANGAGFTFAITSVFSANNNGAGSCTITY